ncbi:MAG: hypothetical protein N3I35_06710 [Clostridia bacterium]|nr:hypothetical protein [Clostridia bacterium]
MGYTHNDGYSATGTGFAVGKKGSEVQVIDSTGNITVPASKELNLTTGQFVTGEKFTINYPNFAAADTAKPFFIAPAACQIVDADLWYATAAGQAGTLNVEKLTSGQAIGSGVSVLASGFNMAASATVPQSGNITSTAADALMAAGNVLALKVTSGAATSLANASLTLTGQWT